MRRQKDDLEEVPRFTVAAAGCVDNVSGVRAGALAASFTLLFEKNSTSVSHERRSGAVVGRIQEPGAFARPHTFPSGGPALPSRATSAVNWGLAPA